MDILVTGGTAFVSRYTAQYFVKKGHNVFVLNRNRSPQEAGVTLIKSDRNDLGDCLKPYHFDAVLDITSYTRTDVENLHRALGEFDDFIFISSSAVYPETLPQPFREDQQCGVNAYWGDYGTNKIEAEAYLQEHISQAYIVRPPYLCGAMNNVYREAFVFDCAEKNRTFYIPKDGTMSLQFFDIEDLCRFLEALLAKKPHEKIFNVGNTELVNICEWVTLCYQVLGKIPEFRYVNGDILQRSYFSFLDYSYVLDVSKQHKLLPDTKPLFRSLQESYGWYREHREAVRKKPLIEFIDSNF